MQIIFSLTCNSHNNKDFELKLYFVASDDNAKACMHCFKEGETQ